MTIEEQIKEHEEKIAALKTKNDEESKKQKLLKLQEELAQLEKGENKEKQDDQDKEDEEDKKDKEEKEEKAKEEIDYNKIGEAFAAGIAKAFADSKEDHPEIKKTKNKKEDSLIV